jgi:hypothetical protein
MNTIWEFGFCYDDRVAIQSNHNALSNKKMAPSTSLVKVLEHDFWGLSVTDFRSHKSYRPLAILSLQKDAWVAQILGTPGAGSMGLSLVQCLVLFVNVSSAVAPQQHHR